MTDSDMPLSSLLAKANYIKQAMANIEKDITEKTFMFTRNGISISMYGSGKINDLSVDSTLAQNSISSSLEDIKKCINSAFDNIEEKRKAAFKQISEDLDVPEQVK